MRKENYAMKSDNNTRGLTIIAVLLGVLIVVIAAQTFYIVRLHNRLNEPARRVDSSSHGLLPDFDDGEPLSSTFDWGTAPFGGGVAWNPAEEMRRMQAHLDQFFNNSIMNFGTDGREVAFAPNIDVQDTGDAYIVKVDLPGSEESNIDVVVKDQRLTISGSQNRQGKGDDGKVMRQERMTGEFKRSLTLPHSVQEDKVTSKYEKGVLIVTIPKAS